MGMLMPSTARELTPPACVANPQVVDLLGQRKGQMLDMGAAVGEGTTQRVKYRIPTRGLLVRHCPAQSQKMGILGA